MSRVTTEPNVQLGRIEEIFKCIDKQGASRCCKNDACQGQVLMTGKAAAGYLALSIDDLRHEVNHGRIHKHTSRQFRQEDLGRCKCDLPKILAGSTVPVSVPCKCLSSPYCGCPMNRSLDTSNAQLRRRHESS